MLSNGSAREDSWESLGQQGNQTSQSTGKMSYEINPESQWERTTQRHEFKEAWFMGGDFVTIRDTIIAQATFSSLTWASGMASYLVFLQPFLSPLISLLHLTIKVIF